MLRDKLNVFVARIGPLGPMFPGFDSRSSHLGWVCWFSTLLREVFPVTPIFPSPQKPTYDLIWGDLIFPNGRKDSRVTITLKKETTVFNLQYMFRHTHTPILNQQLRHLDLSLSFQLITLFFCLLFYCYVRYFCFLRISYFIFKLYASSDT